MSLTTSLFALVLLAACLAAGASLMLAVRSNSRSRAIQTAWESSKPAKLAAEVAALDAALDSHRRMTRSEFGRLWQRMPPSKPKAPVVLEGEYEPLDEQGEVDPDLEAMLRMQRAPAASPVKPNGSA